MSERTPDQSEVAEATAVYGHAGLTALRDGLERLALRHPEQPCRVVQTTTEDGVPVFEMQTWGPAPDTENNYARWLARCNGEPQPPRPVRWLHRGRVQIDRDWSEDEIEAELANWEQHFEEQRRKKSAGWFKAPDCPPGYEGDYDLVDFLYDLRYGR